MTINEHVALFRSLHRLPEQGGRPLALANAWDVASARIVERAGAAAVATTSAGVAWSLGAPDGARLDRDRALDLIARIVAAVGVPVTADIENGFATTADGVATTITGVLAAGAAGVNIEDTDHAGRLSLLPVAAQAERIAAARQAAGPGLFINARVDSYLRGQPDPYGDTVERARAYVAAGADGVFVPGVVDPATVARLVAAVGAPLNILVGPGAPDLAELGRLGVARVSLGSWVAEAAYATAQRAAEEFLSAGTYGALSGALAYGDLNDLLAG